MKRVVFSPKHREYLMRGCVSGWLQTLMLMFLLSVLKGMQRSILWMLRLILQWAKTSSYVQCIKK